MKHLTISLTLATLALAKHYIIPLPPGPYGVDINVAAYTDTSRLDPFAPKPEHRRIVISAFRPVAAAKDCKYVNVPAYPTATAEIFDAEVAFAGVPNGSLEKVEMQICTLSKSTWSNRYTAPAPLVLFSGGLGLSRLWYSALCQAVASYGFTVVSVDHPYDADVVEFPDGKLIYAINSTWDQQQSELDVRVRSKDVSFALTKLSDPAVAKRLFGSKDVPCYEPNKAGIFGHSIGGATAAEAQYEDSRIMGGVNLDGGLYGPVIKQGLEDPFMLFGHLGNGSSKTWVKIWPHLNWKLDIEILNSTHTTFTDIPLLADLIFGEPLPSFVQGIVGMIPGPRARDVVAAYVAAFMGFALKGENEALLKGPSAAYPEIYFEGSPKTPS